MGRGFEFPLKRVEQKVRARTRKLNIPASTRGVSQVPSQTLLTMLHNPNPPKLERESGKSGGSELETRSPIDADVLTAAVFNGRHRLVL